MNRTYRSVSVLACLFTLATASLSGCKSSVVIDGEGEGEGGGASDHCGDFAACEEPSPEPASVGIATPWEDLPPGDVVAAPPGTLLLTFGNTPRSCGEALEGPPSCEPDLHWFAQIPLPTDLQFAGAMVDLEELVEVGFGPFFSESQGAGDTCSGGGGTLLGQLTVVSIDPTAITFRIDGSLDPEFEGTWTVDYCGGDDPVPPPAASVALTQPQLDALTGSVSIPENADLLYVFADGLQNGAAISCGNPYANESTCDVEREVVVVGLTAEFQTPGVYSLAEPGVFLYQSGFGPNGDGTCWGGGGEPAAEGTVEVLAADEGSIHLRVNPSPVTGLPLEVVASRCP